MKNFILSHSISFSHANSAHSIHSISLHRFIECVCAISHNNNNNNYNQKDSFSCGFTRHTRHTNFLYDNPNSEHTRRPAQNNRTQNPNCLAFCSIHNDELCCTNGEGISIHESVRLNNKQNNRVHCIPFWIVCICRNEWIAGCVARDSIKSGCLWI